MRSHASVSVAWAAALLTVAVVGCGTTPPAPASPTGPPPLPTASPSRMSAAAHVGADCGFIPNHGAGSFGSMSSQPAATAAASNPALSVFSSAIRAAALRGELNRMRSFTLFASVNSAFAGLSKTEVTFLRKPGNLIDVIRRQVVPVRITPAQISRGGTVVTLSGSKLALTKAGRVYRVNQATVLCGNIRTANGTLYLIDQVLLPRM